MAISWQGFTTFLQQQIAAVQGAAGRLIDTSTGSITLALGEASSLTALSLQDQNIKLLKATRLATSVGPDVDSWGADFDFSRLPANSATGAVTYARANTANPAIIVPYINADGSINTAGQLVSVGPGGQQFAVTVDTTNATWNASSGTYILPIGGSSVTLPVEALTPGSGGNVQANTIVSFVSPITYIDTVTNALAFTNGVDAETDAAFKARFVNYINSLSRATLAAITNAVLSIQQGLSTQIVANVDTSGAFLAGNFVVYVDDGTGSPPGSLLTQVAAAVEQVRAFTISYNIQPPTVVTANVVLTIVAAPGFTSSNMTGAVATALTAFIDGLPLGAKLPYSRLAQVAYDSTPGIANITGLTLNGVTSDIGGATGQVVRAGSMTVNPG
jgi:uncharacterized phage protein gp47/JayE